MTPEQRQNNINYLLTRLVGLTADDDEVLEQVETKLDLYLSHLENECQHCFDQGECFWCEPEAA